jgi:predicted amidohydrolase
VFDKLGHELAKYSKLHPFNFANEGKYFDAGDDIITFELEGTACSVFICYDLRFPEVFRQVSKDVEVIFVVANWPNSRQRHWEMLLIARAIENQCYVVGVNRIGKDGVGQKFNGSSMVIDPLGEVLLHTNKTNEYSVCDLSLNKVAMVREKFPFLSDMRFIKTK